MQSHTEMHSTNGRFVGTESCPQWFPSRRFFFYRRILLDLEVSADLVLRVIWVLRRVDGLVIIVVPRLVGSLGLFTKAGQIHWGLQKRPQRCLAKNDRMPTGPRSAGPQFDLCDMMTGSDRMLYIMGWSAQLGWVLPKNCVM